MSAIAGIVRLDGRPVEPSEIDRMLGTMAHRGPDGTHVWTDGALGLGHGMLHTTPESLHEVLPWTDPASGLTITADARIDNREELTEALGLGAEAKALPDSAFILRAYERWGQECLDHLVGDFAFAIWNPRARRLFCARDQFGIRPFYYYWKPGRFLTFATELKAMLALPEVPKRLNEVNLADNLVILREDDTSTIYEGLVHLPRAHAMTLADGELRLWRYYTLAPRQDMEGWSDEAYIEGFRELFEEAVRCRVRSAFPVGSHLSGGLDSSAVACVARDILAERGERLHTFTLTFESVPECDESNYAEEVIAQGGFVPHYVAGDALGPLSNLEELYTLLDDRSVGGNQHNVWAMLKAGRDAGVRVMLDGIDGDNTVGHGFRYLSELAEGGAWDVFAREVRVLVERHRDADHGHPFERAVGSLNSLVTQQAYPVLEKLAEEKCVVKLARAVLALRREFGVSPRQTLGSVWRRLLVPRAVLQRRKRVYVSEGGEQMLAALDSGFVSRVRIRERMETSLVDSYLAEAALGEREYQQRLLGSAMLQLLLTTTSHFGSHFQIEPRHPFMDRRLIEYCLALPPSLSLRNGWPRYFLRKSLETVMPRDVTRRIGKTDMTAGFVHGLIHHDGKHLQTVLSSPGLLANYLDLSSLRRLHERFLASDTPRPGAGQGTLASVAAVAIWVNRWFGEEATTIETSQNVEMREASCS